MERNPFTNRHMHSRPLIAIGLVVLAGTSFAAAGGGDLHGDRVLGPLDGLAGSREVYRIHVQPGTDRLEITTRGGWGDADLYLRHGDQPTRRDYDRRSIGKATDERVVVDGPAGGWWYLVLVGYEDYRDVTLTVDVTGQEASPGPGVLRDGEAISRLRGLAGSQRVYAIDVPDDAERLTVSTSGGFGDLDLYLSRDRHPDRRRYDHRSTGKDNNESIEVDEPREGRWYVLVRGYSAYAGATLRAEIDEDHGNDADDCADDALALISPRPGEVWRTDTPVTIRWRADDRITSLRLAYSLDDGRTWTTRGLPAFVDADDGRLTVRLGDSDRLVTSRARIRLSATFRPNVSVTSGRFAIVDGRRRAPRRPEGDRYEPDDSPARARVVEPGSVETHSITPGDDDWLLLRVDRAADYELVFPATGLELRAEVYTSEGSSDRLHGRFDDIRSGRAITLQAGAATRYFRIRLSGEDDSDRGVYQVMLRRTRRGRDRRGRRDGFADVYEPNGTTHQATPMRPGSVQTHRIDESGDLDWLVYDPQNGPAYVRVTESDVALRADVYVNRGEGNKRVATIRRLAVGQRIALEAVEGVRDYKVRFQAADHTDTGNYRVEVIGRRRRR